MKKTAKAVVIMLFCLSLVCAAFVPAYAAGVGKVKGLKATNITYNSAKLTWTKVSGAKGYDVEKLSGKKWEKVKEVKTNSYSLTKLTTGTTYKYRVRAFVKKAFSKKTYGSYSATLSVKPMPAKVTGVKKSSVTYNSAKLSWKKVAGATGYQVQVYKNKKWTNLKKVTATSYTVTKLTTNTTYKYRVAAYRTVKKKTYTGSYSATVSVKPALTQVKGLKATVASPSSVKLTWTKASSGGNYQIQQYNASKKTWKTIKKQSGTSYTVSKLTPGTTYKFRVLAYATVNKKTYTGKASATVSAKPAVPNVGSFKKGTVTATSVSFSWAAAKNASGYSFEFYKNGKWAKTDVKNKTSYTVSGLTASTAYQARVKAYYTLSGKKYYSPSYSSTVKVTTAPDQVKGLKAEAQSKTATLTWTAVKGAQGYIVYKYDESAKTYKSVQTVTTNKCVLTGLKIMTSYKCKVKAFHKANGSQLNGEASAACSFKTSFDEIKNFSVQSSYGGNGLYYYLRWDYFVPADAYKGTYLYQLQSYDVKTGKWTDVSDKMAVAYSSYKLTENAFKIKTDVKTYYTTVSWSAVKGATSYIVQTKNLSGSWKDEMTVTSTSAKLYLSPNTNTTVRVLACDGKFRVRAVGEKYSTNYLSLDAPLSASSEVTFKTKTPPAFNSSSNESKTVYALMLVQAINNTKNEEGTVKIDYSSLMKTNVDEMKAKIGKVTIDNLKGLISLLEGSSLLDKEEKKELEALSNGMTDKTTVKGTFTNGSGIVNETVESNGETKNNPNAYYKIDQLLSPSGIDAYLYNQHDVNSFDKRIKSISVKNGSNGSVTITMKIVKETANGKGSTSYVHDGLCEGLGDVISDNDEIVNSASVGETTLTATINKNYTLDSLKIDMPIVTSSTMNLTDDSGSVGNLSMFMTTSSTTTTTYKFTR